MSDLTRFEVTRLISARALQLSLGAPGMIKASKEASMIDIAKEEFDKKVIPISVLREFPDGSIEKIEAN
ncbi:MAG: DNA-directed RNA polymerase subunit K [Candidatus Diapherotrites archaeon]|uniref:DNA-directed RNA polymerase subunit K n=1 Tax=Candidatus Iainarchaeum sp. TaxID=3101447 RepID=A0A2D6LQA4_9ARCH|nr:DNA-directed RNA polymerase subunit K [Candidatus Diapherotrites archaeon]|tara:strand:+ start:4548 stop:4754 length:207 start_codon:yes stop_codon:yes gene_type:complete